MSQKRTYMGDEYYKMSEFFPNLLQITNINYKSKGKKKVNSHPKNMPDTCQDGYYQEDSNRKMAA